MAQVVARQVHTLEAAGSTPAPATTLAVLALLLAGCVSSKERIARALDASDTAAVEIQGEARAAQAEIGAAQALELPKGARKPLDSAASRQDRIADLALDVRGAAAQGREGLSGVIDRPTPLWRKLLWAVVGLVLLVVSLTVWAPGILLRLIPAAAGLIPKAKRSLVAIARAQFDDEAEPTPPRIREAIAAARAGDRQIDALWRAEE